MRKPPRSASAPEVSVLRIGHRAGRDPRLSTHVALAARAFGARRLYLNPPDPDLTERVGKIASRWGGAFEVAGAPDWKKVVREFDGGVVHLTMYGEPWATVGPQLSGKAKVLLVVGGAKVPPDLYRLAHWNLAMGPQPHSEVAAVAVVLDRLLGGPDGRTWPGARTVIVPQRRGKKVVERPRAEVP